MTSIIKVDEIQNTGGTTGLTIDSSGRVLNPNVVAWNAYKNTIQTASGANEVVTWVGTTLNEGSGFQTSGPNVNKFVAPVAGVYFCGCTWLSDNDSNHHDVRLQKNGSNVVFTRNAAANIHETTSFTWVGDLSVNDTLAVVIANSGDKVYGDSSLYWTTWNGYLIG
jgi:hypothetical protein